jgi:hypothetical protein
MPSSTPAPTRRRFVKSTAAVLGAAALAGCGGSGSASSSSRAAPNADPPDDALTDPTHVTLRNPERAPIVSGPESTVGGTNAESDQGADESTPQFDEWHHLVVVDADRASSLTFADVDGVDDARRLLEETDFDSESVYVERSVVPECYERRLCWIRWSDSEIETDYARILRDADVACEADAEDVVTNVIRLPVALDPDQISSYGSSSGSGPCRRPEGERMEGESA